jgi:hypothetical protein
MVTTYTQGSRQMKKLLLAAAIASVQLVAAQAASAATFAFTPTFSSPNDGDGLTFSGTFKQSGAFTFNLNPGSSFTITDFLTINTHDTNGSPFLGGQVTQTDPLSVLFNFTQPSGGNGTANGTGSETLSFNFFGSLTAADGTITWTSSPTIAFGSSLLTIALSNGAFHDADGFFHSASPDQSADINATFTLIQTPLPAALPLFAAGLGGMGMLGWRRKRKAATLATA